MTHNPPFADPDFRLGLGVTVFALFLYFIAIPWGIVTPGSVRSVVLSPTFWPGVIALLLLLLGLFLAGQRWLAPTPLETSESPQDPGRAALRVLAVAGLLVGFYLLIPWLGMVLTATLAFIAYALIIATPHRLWTLVVAIVLPLVLKLFFQRLAGVPIPAGSLW